MKLKDLNPKVSATDIMLNCPCCGSPMVFSARYNTPPANGVYSWTGDLSSGSWDTFSVVPSIQVNGHARKSKNPNCRCHFTITNGEIHFS